LIFKTKSRHPRQKKKKQKKQFFHTIQTQKNKHFRQLYLLPKMPL